MCRAFYIHIARLLQRPSSLLPSPFVSFTVMASNTGGSYYQSLMRKYETLVDIVVAELGKDPADKEKVAMLENQQSALKMLMEREREREREEREREERNAMPGALSWDTWMLPQWMTQDFPAGMGSSVYPCLMASAACFVVCCGRTRSQLVVAVDSTRLSS